MTNRAEKLLGALKRRGFVVMHEHGSLQVVPSEQLTLDDRASIDRARSILVRLLCERNHGGK